MANSAVARAPSAEDLAMCDVKYPMDPEERMSFKTEQGKRVTPYQWAVYDLVKTIPAGKVITYKEVCVALGEGSPRSVGGAMRKNPFAPLVPCHRVIASNLFVGGFRGEWGVISGGAGHCKRKMEMLSAEGVELDEAGFVRDQIVLCRPSQPEESHAHKKAKI